RIARALYILAREKNSEVKSMTVALSESLANRIEICFAAAFQDASAAIHAVDTLRLTPRERMDRDHPRSTPGTAVEACYWLRQEAREWSIDKIDLIVYLRYWFEFVVME